MRVLLVPELYRPTDATANGSLNDLVTLAERWLDRDPFLHVYWLLPPREQAGYDAAYVLADRERVTLLEAERLLAGHRHEDAFVESGHTTEELLALESVYDRHGYVDVAVDQLVTGRYDLFKWLCELGEHSYADVRPVELIGYVHDLRLPFKRHGWEYPDELAVMRELLSTLVVDGLWFKAGVDARRLREYADGILHEQTLDDLLDTAVTTGSPVDFGAFEESYRDAPRVFHVAGSGWGKKNLDVVLSVGRILHERYGIRTLMTNMDPIPASFGDLEFVDPLPRADRETYERALRAGDLAVCASDHETMARTPFEQAASGQVLVLRDRPWIYDCVPEDHPFVGGLDELEELVIRAVERWDEAVTANRRLVEHVRRVRDPGRCGRRTYEDLRRRVRDRVAACEVDPERGTIDAVRSALEEVDEPVALDALNRATVDHSADGSPVLAAGSGFTVTDLVYVLRSLGYRDTGQPGTPEFVRVDEAGDAVEAFSRATEG